jgi:transcriptional regulator with XRE-family HTH domain
MVKIRGEWTPKVNYNELASLVLRNLSHKTSRLTGDEIKFIRTYFEMTLQEFAKRFCVTHVAVLKWEKSKNSSTAMTWATEKDIRLFVLFKLGVKAAELAKLYAELELLPGAKSVTMNIDMQKLGPKTRTSRISMAKRAEKIAA